MTRPALPQDFSNPLTSLERNEVTGALGGASSAEAVGGISAVTLTVLGLAGVMSSTMLGIATLVAGAALFAAGLASIAAFAKLDWDASPTEEVVSRGGFAIEALCGMAGMMTGALVLADLASTTAIAVAAVVMGSSIVLSAPARSQLEWTKLEGSRRAFEPSVDHAVRNAVGMSAMTGMFAAILGIMALTGASRTLTFGLSSVLLIGGALILSASALLCRLAVIAEPPELATGDARPAQTADADFEITIDDEGLEPAEPATVPEPVNPADTRSEIHELGDPEFVVLQAMDIVELEPLGADDRQD